ncbi:MAG: hypothetical protein EOP06_11170 [Proteobacteria bacterium]|nr:MAG: hypothetical protein EOP06_11170 [Pseudomonadota bacterium]
MIKKILATACCLLPLTLSSLAFADDGHQHSETICSTENTAICAHLGMPKAFNTRDEARFIAHVEIADEAPVSDMKVDLVMNMDGHKHGTAPVTLKDMGKNHFLVSNAYFVMAGTWTVKLDFTFEGKAYQLDIPVTVAE